MKLNHISAHPEDFDDIEKALDLSKEIAKAVDDQVQSREKYLQLLEVHEKTEPRANTIYKGQRIQQISFYHPFLLICRSSSCIRAKYL